MEKFHVVHLFHSLLQLAQRRLPRLLDERLEEGAEDGADQSVGEAGEGEEDVLKVEGKGLRAASELLIC